jgi:hypothetical protein
MAASTYEATIRIGHSMQKVTVQADTQTNAKAMIEAQYGKGCLYNEPMKK